MGADRSAERAAPNVPNVQPSTEATAPSAAQPAARMPAAPVLTPGGPLSTMPPPAVGTEEASEPFGDSPQPRAAAPIFACDRERRRPATHSSPLHPRQAPSPWRRQYSSTPRARPTRVTVTRRSSRPSRSRWQSLRRPVRTASSYLTRGRANERKHGGRRRAVGGQWWEEKWRALGVSSAIKPAERCRNAYVRTAWRISLGF